MAKKNNTTTISADQKKTIRQHCNALDSGKRSPVNNQIHALEEAGWTFARPSYKEGLTVATPTGEKYHVESTPNHRGAKWHDFEEWNKARRAKTSKKSSKKTTGKKTTGKKSAPKTAKVEAPKGELVTVKIGEEDVAMELGRAEKLQNLLHYLNDNSKDLECEVIGTWFWITGNTREHKDTLKGCGCFWSAKKTAWYFMPVIKKRRTRGSFESVDAVREYNKAA